MVERPIKKSERQAATTTEVQETSEAAQGIEGVQEANPAPEQRSTTPRPSKDRPAKDKEERKGRRSQQKDEGARPPLSPALMRGPKPMKPKPPVIEAAAKEQEVTSEEPLTQIEPEDIPDNIEPEDIPDN